MKAFLAGLFLVAAATASPWGPSASWESWTATSSSSASPGASPSGSTQQVFYGRFISTPNPDQLSINTGAVLVTSNDGRGTIQNAVWNVTDVQTALSSLGVDASVPVIYAADDGFFFPGFIDSHIHAPQYPNLGLFEGTLLDWLQKYTYPMESSLSTTNSPLYANSTAPPDPYARAHEVYTHVVASTLAHGTTTASYFATVDVGATNILAELALSMGQRAYIGRTCQDNTDNNPWYYRDNSTAEAIANTWSSIKYIQSLDPTGDLVAPIVTPRFAPGVTNESMTVLGQIANETNLRLQMHISENVREVALVAQMYPDQSSYAGVYDAHNLLTDRTVLAHGVHLTDDEMDLIAARGSGVSHCPASNSALGSGIAQVRRMLSKGVNVGLGTDTAGGYNPSVLEAVRQAFLVSRELSFLANDDRTLDVPTTLALWLGTMGGAKVVYMDGRLGGFEPGMLWDVQEITLDSGGDVDIFGWETWTERVSKWVWNGSRRNVNRVWVGGRQVSQR
ncbi:hypothetical protein LTR10_015073 [Elasticomyces elasticus]|uniref:Amidohydrolase-related domain-containing protein n=1 Tax=Exophiala sideris TaxID=1016849 RepID=A0ABR0JQT0_9EURO|nr:hypothetical protein LTR10_015073 [Elasticomyces elasticus]KAK5034730.1 hypothetical protein LTR13_006387 [Exophiala sideris]KAK5039949.1 hypothetical protein LTS07_000444 [Exophiala sideris]KAK5068328.1 hypothetical protein LTR69_000446 [Exophiala sideris]KAK5187629.1 hypothetical protein LTR44_000445 [Eurotiomycetes sp. CCFEE 6388]